MKDLVMVQKKLVPDLLNTMRWRYQILQRIFLTQPIGRRTLAQSLHTTERILRAEVDFFKQQGLLAVESIGMHLTDAGYQLLQDLERIMREVIGLSDLELRLSERLGIPKVIVVPGNSDQDPVIKRELGYAAAALVRMEIRDEDTIAVTGGTTIALLAEMMPITQPRNVTVVPARGGLGEHVEYLANTIASRLAEKLGGTYKMFHVPDFMSDEVYQSLLSEPHVQERLAQIRSARIVVHGIGEALRMAERRQLPSHIVEHLRKQNAVAEAFGYYFDPSGQIVYSMKTVGLQLKDLDAVERIVAVAGGESKAKAIQAIAKGYRQDVLVTDEGAAHAILQSS
jgi:central glycolytic genes regulator